MGTITDKLNTLISTKQAIRTAIESKGQTISDIDPFSSYATKIEAIKTSSNPTASLDPVEVYNNTRPTDWLQMPEPQDNEMYLLFHIPDGVSSLIAFTVTCTGNYTIELGTVTNGSFIANSSKTMTIATGQKYENELFASDFGDLTSDGFKQVMIKVSGTDILTWEPSTHSKKVSATSCNIMEIRCKLPKSTNVKLGNKTTYFALKSIRYYTQIGENEINEINGMFYLCFSLIAVLELNISKATIIRNLFENCSSLIAIPKLDMSKATAINGMFSGCSSLKHIPELNTSQASIFNAMFNGCESLVTIPKLDTSHATGMFQMFYNCQSLIIVPELDTSQVTNMDNIFTSCFSLAKFTLNPLVTDWAGYNIKLNGCSLGHQALVDLFNSLPTITSSKALTLTGNPGVLELTDTEKAIATNKNWTLTL